MRSKEDYVAATLLPYSTDQVSLGGFRPSWTLCYLLDHSAATS